MPKFISQCGYVIDLSRIPGKHEHKLISEIEIENLVRLIENNGITPDHFFDFLDSKAITVYKCPNCGRLYLEEKKGNFVPYQRQLAK